MLDAGKQTTAAAGPRSISSSSRSKTAAAQPLCAKSTGSDMLDRRLGSHPILNTRICNSSYSSYTPSITKNPEQYWLYSQITKISLTYGQMAIKPQKRYLAIWPEVRKNIVTGNTSQAITPFHFFTILTSLTSNFYHQMTFNIR